MSWRAIAVHVTPRSLAARVRVAAQPPPSERISGSIFCSQSSTLTGPMCLYAMVPSGPTMKVSGRP